MIITTKVCATFFMPEEYEAAEEFQKQNGDDWIKTETTRSVTYSQTKRIWTDRRNNHATRNDYLLRNR